MKFFRYFFVIIITGLCLVFFVWLKPNLTKIKSNSEEANVKEVQTTYCKNFAVDAGLTYSILMQNTDLPTSTRQAIFAAARDVYDLSNIKVGHDISLFYDKLTNDCVEFIYPIDTEEELRISLRPPALPTTTEPVWVASRVPIVYDIKVKTVEGMIETSIYQAALDQGIDERAVIAFADVFQWSVDFAWEVQKGDLFKFIYEERYRDGQYVMPGKILAGKFINNGKTLYAFYYQDQTGKEGYYDQAGDSVQKQFLKAPLAFKYISSGFTTGLRYIEAFNMSTGHRAVDYAAAYGTPIRSVGDGTVVFAGWNGPYGRMVKIRHNSVYQTNYGHMSKIAVRAGQTVTQAQTIGYVGSTGLSTGPHLHFEMVKNGTKINALKEELPPTEGIVKEDEQTYLAAIGELKKKLD